MAEKTYLELVVDCAQELDRNDLVKLQDWVQKRLLSKSRSEIRIGQTVKFTTKHGGEVRGTVERVNEKSVKVLANFDRYGQPTQFPVHWTVSPQLV